MNSKSVFFSGFEETHVEKLRLLNLNDTDEVSNNLRACSSNTKK